MIIKNTKSNDYVVMSPSTEFVAFYQFKPTPETAIRITTIFYGKDKPFVQISRLIEGVWSSDSYFRFEVYMENAEYVKEFIRRADSKVVLETIDLSYI